ncbi:MAG: hypothetical protein ABIQ39_05595, partial [Ilumatobacteraceae bacterium]
VATLLDLSTRRHRRADDQQVSAARELATLRRELNRAVSILGHKYRILGLMPTPTIEQLRSERHPTQVLQPGDPSALLAHKGHPHQPPDEISRQRRLELQVNRLQNEIDAIHGTKVFRWTRGPRVAYRRLRQMSDRIR